MLLRTRTHIDRRFIKCALAELIGQELAGVTNIDRRLFLVSGQYPDLHLTVVKEVIL